MNKLNVATAALLALTVAACSGAPTWNTSVFPQEPQYGTGGAKAEAEANK